MSQRGAFVLGPDLRIAQVLGADMASGSQIRQFRHRLVLLYLRESGNCLASCSIESSLIALRLGPYGGEHEHIAHPSIQGAMGCGPHAGAAPAAHGALYRRVSDVFVLAAVGPEAQSDQRGFDRAARQAVARLAEIEED